MLWQRLPSTLNDGARPAPSSLFIPSIVIINTSDRLTDVRFFHCDCITMTFRLRRPLPSQPPPSPSPSNDDRHLHYHVPQSASLQPPPLSALPPGVILSPNSGHPVTSWGLRPIDVALNGGLPLGSLTLVVEDCPTWYHVPLLSYVTVQGLAHHHAVAIASFNRPLDQVMADLPGILPSSSTPRPVMRPDVVQPQMMMDMKIAWRYQNQNQTQQHQQQQLLQQQNALQSFTNDFDLSRPCPTISEKAPISCIPIDLIPNPTSSSTPLHALLADIERHLHNARQRDRRLVSRIVIHSLPVHHHHSHDHQQSSSSTSLHHIVKFLSSLRTIARVYGAVVVVSCPSPVRAATTDANANASNNCAAALRAVCDAMLVIDSFDGLGARVAGLGSQWLGVVIVKKTFRFGKGPPFPGRGDVWVFKRGRRRYVFERATCAPDEEMEKVENFELSSHDF